MDSKFQSKEFGFQVPDWSVIVYNFDLKGEQEVGGKCRNTLARLYLGNRKLIPLLNELVDEIEAKLNTSSDLDSQFSEALSGDRTLSQAYVDAFLSILRERVSFLPSELQERLCLLFKERMLSGVALSAEDIKTFLNKPLEQGPSQPLPDIAVQEGADAPSVDENLGTESAEPKTTDQGGQAALPQDQTLPESPSYQEQGIKNEEPIPPFGRSEIQEEEHRPVRLFRIGHYMYALSILILICVPALLIFNKQQSRIVKSSIPSSPIDGIFVFGIPSEVRSDQELNRTVKTYLSDMANKFPNLALPPVYLEGNAPFEDMSEATRYVKAANAGGLIWFSKIEESGMSRVRCSVVSKNDVYRSAWHTWSTKDLNNLKTYDFYSRLAFSYVVEVNSKEWAVRGDAEKALKVYVDATNSEPDLLNDYETVEGLALALAGVRNFVPALTFIQRAKDLEARKLTRDSSDLDRLDLDHAQILLRLGKYELAWKVLTAGRMPPKRHSWLFNTGFAVGGSGEVVFETDFPKGIAVLGRPSKRCMVVSTSEVKDSASYETMFPEAKRNLQSVVLSNLSSYASTDFGKGVFECAWKDVITDNYSKSLAYKREISR